MQGLKGTRLNKEVSPSPCPRPVLIRSGAVSRRGTRTVEFLYGECVTPTERGISREVDWGRTLHQRDSRHILSGKGTVSPGPSGSYLPGYGRRGTPIQWVGPRGKVTQWVQSFGVLTERGSRGRTLTFVLPCFEERLRLFGI